MDALQLALRTSHTDAAPGTTSANPGTPALALPASPFPQLIMRAGLEHEKFIVHLAAKFSKQLGFIPRVGLEQYIRWGCVGLALENDQPAGYVLGRDKYRWQPLLRPITQAAVCFDAQRRHHGLALVQRVCQKAIDSGQIGVQAMCAADLEANEFWKIAGFQAIGTTTPNNARGRDIICWRRFFTNRLPLWAAMLPPVSGYRGAKTATPNRHKFITKKQSEGEAISK